MVASLVRILDGNTFVVSDERGDIEASKTDPTGLFSYDIRFLSTWVLTVNDLRLNALSTDDLQYFEARFFLVPATGTVYIDPKLSVIRQRAVGDGFHEELTILSHSDEPADLTIHMEVASGRRNPMATALRGAMTMEGNPRLLIRVQRLFPAPVGMPESTGPRSMGKRRS